MVVKSPFLSEKDRGLSFVARNEGLYRSLSSLFPGVSLQMLSKVASLVASRALRAGKRYVAEPSSTKPGRSHPVSHAALTLSRELGEGVPIKTWQNYLEIARDMRLVRKLSAIFTVHTYGYPLVDLAKLPGSEETIRYLERAFYMDRILFEDLQPILSVLEITKECGGELSLFQCGLRMREGILDRLVDAENRTQDPHLRDYIRGKKREASETLRKASEKEFAKRRTELEFHVRREWLLYLKLVENQDGEWSVSDGSRHVLKLRDRFVGQEFFETRVYGVIHEAIGQIKPTEDLTMSFEELFHLIAQGRRRIVETYEFATLFAMLALLRQPLERSDVLRILRQRIDTGETGLILQSGYRTQDYYLKKV